MDSAVATLQSHSTVILESGYQSRDPVRKGLYLPKLVCKDRVFCPFKCKNVNTRLHKNQANVTPPKETNKTSTADPEVMKIHELSDKEFRIILLKNVVKRTHRYIRK